MARRTWQDHAADHAEIHIVPGLENVIEIERTGQIEWIRQHFNPALSIDAGIRHDALFRQRQILRIQLGKIAA
ncbi:hypothetical protein D3C71_2147390 [compost metagenome]